MINVTEFLRDKPMHGRIKAVEAKTKEKMEKIFFVIIQKIG